MEIEMNWQDDDGLWLRGSLVITASELHDLGYIFFKQRWVLRPSHGGSVENFQQGVDQ